MAILYALVAQPADARGPDADRDGLSNRYELMRSHTRVLRADTDRDRLRDGFEVRRSHTKPRRADTDGDGLLDGVEVRTTTTDPLRMDTDRDGTFDGVELMLGTDPRKPHRPKKTLVPPLADVTAPETTIASGPSGTVSSASASFSFTASETGSTFECQLDASAWAACSSPRVYSGLPNGPHTFSVRATDAAGNIDASPVSQAWTVNVVPAPAPDATPPETTIGSGPSGTVTTGSATFTFSANEPSTFTCSLDGSAFTSCASPKSYTGLANGSHTLQVRATDSAQNTDASPATRTWTVSVPPADVSPPETTISSGPSGTVSTASASFSFTSSETGSTFECQLDAGAWAACSSPRAYSGLANGSHTFNVRATDSAQNTDATPASRSWTVDIPPPPDLTPPDTTIASGPSGTVSTASASFSFTASESGSTLECQLDASAWAACSSPRAYSGLANGSHTFSVRATDVAGNADTSPASRTWTVNVPPPDVTPPDTTIGSGPSGTVTTGSATFDFSATEASAFTCSLDGSAFMSCSSPKSYSGLANGSHTFSVRATDAAGNADTSPASRTWTVNATQAAPGTANLWVDPTGGTCTRQPTAGAYSATQACGSFNAAFQAASPGDTVRVKAGSYGDQNFTERTLTAPSIEFRTDGGTVTFGVVNMRGADYLKFYGSWKGTSVRANSCTSGPTNCQQSRSIAWSGLTLDPHFTNNKAVDLMGNAIGWTFRNINFCCVHNDKIVNLDNFYNMGQTTDIVFEHGSVHSQTVDVNAGSAADVHTECFWNLGPQSLVIRNIHSYGCNGTIVMNLADSGDALVPANLMLENNVFEPPMNDDGAYTGCTGQSGTDTAYRGVNYIRNNIFQAAYCMWGNTSRTITIANNIGPGMGCGKSGVTYTSNRWTNQDCSTSDLQDGSALASSRYVGAPRTDAEASNTQVGSQVHGDFRSVSGAAQIGAGSATFGFDFDFAPRSTSPDQGPFEFGASAPGNEPPTANFITPAAGANATFVGEPSIDPDGTITEYRWDWNNDGTVDTTTGSSSTTHSVSVGDVVRLTVVDDDGSTSAAKIVQLL